MFTSLFGQGGNLIPYNIYGEFLKCALNLRKYRKWLEDQTLIQL